jgi:hypothetical protein
MKTRYARLLLIGFFCSFTWLSAPAATRVCSVYLESYSALQKQIYLAAEMFQTPQLGAMPMMISQSLPGAAQMDNGKPVALHILDIGSGEMGFVLEVTPAGTAEAYLQAIAGAEATLPAPVKGVYELPNGTSARIAGSQVLLAMKGSDPAACLGKGTDAPPAMPAFPSVPGVIRVSLAPAALLPQLEKLKKTMATMPGAADPGQRTLETVFDFYGLFLGQMDTLQIGLDIQKEGVFFHSRLTPKPGSDIAALVASLKSVRSDERAFVEANSLFGCAVGSFTLTPRLKTQIVDLYAKMLASTPNFESAQANEFSMLMSQSMEAVGAPMAFCVNPSTNSRALLLQGVMNVSNPSAYLDKQLALMKTPAYQKMMSQSGMQIPEPTRRAYKGFTVYTWKMLFDEEAFAKVIRSSLPSNAPPHQVEAAVEAGMKPMRAVMQLFSEGYEYAATPKGVAFGMGAPAMIENTINRVQAPAGASPEADRIQTLLAPAAAPYVVGRLSLSKVVGLVMAMKPELAAALQQRAQTLPAGEGVVFAHWANRGEACSALLIPSSEINAVKAQIQAVQSQTKAKRQNRRAPKAAAPAETAE